MFRRAIFAVVCAAAACAALSTSADQAQAQEHAYNRVWGGAYPLHDWERFYHYPYVYYPQNFWGNEYYRSSESLYYRYPPEMRVPVYNKRWHNYYPQAARYAEHYSGFRYHSGHHFMLDVF